MSGCKDKVIRKFGFFGLPSLKCGKVREINEL